MRKVLQLTESSGSLFSYLSIFYLYFLYSYLLFLSSSLSLRISSGLLFMFLIRSSRKGSFINPLPPKPCLRSLFLFLTKSGNSLKSINLSPNNFDLYSNYFLIFFLFYSCSGVSYLPIPSSLKDLLIP